jgi:hypothetical protein
MTAYDATWIQGTQVRSDYKSQVSAETDAKLDAFAKLELTPAEYGADGFETLVDDLQRHIGVPVNGYAVAAYLESRGWLAADAVKFGESTLVALGDRIWRDAWTDPWPKAKAESAASAEALSAERIPLRGVYFLALVMIQFVGLVWFGLSLGSGRGLSLVEATWAGVGLLLGLVWANGLGQLLAREPLQLQQQGDLRLASMATLRLLSIAIGGALLFALVAGGVAIWSGGVVQMVLLCGGYFLLAGVFWLLVNVLFVHDLALWAIASVFAAVVVVGLSAAFLAEALPPQFIPGAALLLANALMLGCFLAFWGVQRLRQGATRRLSHLRSVAFEQWAYVFYGFGAMLLIVVDRFVAAFAAGTPGQGVLRVQYEIVIGWALLAFILAIALQELLLGRFMLSMRAGLRRFSVADEWRYEAGLARSFWLRVLALAGFFALMAVLVSTIVSSASLLPPAWQVLMPAAVGRRMLLWALIGYGLLALAMMNTGLLIALSRPRRVLAPLLFALLLDLGVAWWSASLLGYPGSISGLVAGALALWIITSLQVQTLLQSPAYALHRSA